MKQSTPFPHPSWTSPDISPLALFARMAEHFRLMHGPYPDHDEPDFDHQDKQRLTPEDMLEEAAHRSHAAGPCCFYEEEVSTAACGDHWDGPLHH